MVEVIALGRTVCLNAQSSPWSLWGEAIEPNRYALQLNRARLSATPDAVASANARFCGNYDPRSTMVALVLNGQAETNSP